MTKSSKREHQCLHRCLPGPINPPIARRPSAEGNTEMVTRIRVALPTAFPYQVGFADLAGRIAKLPP